MERQPLEKPTKQKRKKRKKPQNELLKEDIERVVEILNYAFWPDI